MIQIIKAIFKRNESEVYTHLANIDWNKECHYKSNNLTYFKHMYLSLRCAWYLFTCVLFCLFHSVVPNINSKYATKKLERFEEFYTNLKERLQNV